ncbi:hypothetical protein BMT54_11825 [Pasteurellaceae bacterium 15-036681]|nr:hypothetical protein BMT54_11825 [Pasteurellaceae bacterium 15-036681]
MEWQGIDLSGNPMFSWIQNASQNLLKLSVSLITSGALASLIYYFAIQLEQQNQQKQQVIEQHQQELSIQQQQINKLITHTEQVHQTRSFSSKRIQGVINYLKQLPISGGLDVVQLYHDEETQQDKLKLIGKLNHSIDFERLEQQLKQHGYNYNVAHFQINDKHQINFSLIIELRPISAEKELGENDENSK